CDGLGHRVGPRPVGVHDPRRRPRRLRTARRRPRMDRGPRPTPRGGPPRRAPPDPTGDDMSAGVLDIHLTDDDAEAALVADARAGLTASPKSLPPKWFYDA